MQRIYYLLSLLFCLLLSEQTFSQTNVYYPFASQSKWSQAFYSYCGDICNGGIGPIVTDNYGFYFKIVNDTFINNKIYHKLNYANTWAFYQIEQYIEDANLGPPFQENLIGAIREDSLHRIYYRNFNIDTDIGYDFYGFPKDSDVLIYDFNLVAGDSFLINVFGNRQRYYIAGYDSLLVGNSYRKVLLISQDDSTDQIIDGWCEGIGSINGGIFEEYMFGAEFSDYTFNCFSINDTLLFPQNFTGSCDTIILASINTPQINKLSLKIFPNPASDELYLKFTQGYSIKQISIYNYFGQIVYKSSSQYLGGTTQTIDVSNFSAGLYFVKAMSDEGVLTSKFLKQ